MTPAIPRDSAKKRPVVVSLPPKKSFDFELSVKHLQHDSEPSTCTCACAVASNRIKSSSSTSNSESGSNISSDLTSMLFLSKKQPGQKGPESQQLPIATSIPLEVTACNSEVNAGEPSAAAGKPESEEQKKIFISSHGNLYDDPAVMHVIEHSKDYYEGQTRKLSRAHTLQDGFHPVCAPNYCPDRIWDSLANKIEHLIDVKIRSTFNPIRVIGDDARLNNLELTAAILDRRISELEHPQKHEQQEEQRRQQQRQRRQSMPVKGTMVNEDEDTLSQSEMNDIEKAALQTAVSNLKSMLLHQQQGHANNSNSCGGRGSSFSSSKNAVEDDGARMQQLQRECQGFQVRLAEEQRRSKKLELEHVDFHKRQIEDHIKMEKLRQRIQTLESELSKQQQGPGRNSNSSNRPNYLHRREQKTTHTHPHYHHHSKLPTPGSSPLSSHPEHHKSHQEEESVREEDGYLIFNTNINGELIHCKVKIPTMTASVRSPSSVRRVTDMALMSPPMTRACSPRDMVSAGSKKKSGLNPNAAEWRNGTWK